MGDYVPFATVENWNTKTGFNGFPFQTEPWTNTPMPSHVEVDLEQAIKWVWRVRKWKFSLSLSVSGFAGFGGTTQPYTAGPLTSESICEARYSTQYSTFRRLINRERDIPLTAYETAWKTSGTSNGPLSTSQDGSFYWLNTPPSCFPLTFSFAARPKQDSSTNKTYLSFFCSEIASITHWGQSVYIQFGEIKFAPSTQFTVYIDGIPTIWEYATQGYCSVTSISAQVDPIEYWPYAAPDKILYPRDGYNVGDPHPNAGLPIYDTATGATLRDPVTGFDIEL